MICIYIYNVKYNFKKSVYLPVCCFLSGTAENTKQAHLYISQLAKGKEKNIKDILPSSVVKRFNLDVATNQYSIASSLDSFDVDAIAPPASPGKMYNLMYIIYFCIYLNINIYGFICKYSCYL